MRQTESCPADLMSATGQRRGRLRAVSRVRRHPSTNRTSNRSTPRRPHLPATAGRTTNPSDQTRPPQLTPRAGSTKLTDISKWSMLVAMRWSHHAGQATPCTWPAWSAKAKKAVGQKIRAWHLNRRSGTDLTCIAEEIKPQVRGGINYYGSFYRSTLYSLALRRPGVGRACAAARVGHRVSFVGRGQLDRAVKVSRRILRRP